MWQCMCSVFVCVHLKTLEILLHFFLSFFPTETKTDLEAGQKHFQRKHFQFNRAFISRVIEENQS